MSSLLYTDPRLVGATTKAHGSPYAKEINMDEMFRMVAGKKTPSSSAVNVPQIPPGHHLEIKLRMPPFPQHTTRLTSYRMMIHLYQALNTSYTSVCATPGLTVFTSVGHDRHHFNECPRIGTEACKFLCTCNRGTAAPCMLYMRLETPMYGYWDLPNQIKHIKYLWLKN